MHLPNYKDGSIVNLISSIIKALGGKPLYKPLKNLNPKELSTKNVVLLFIDALGYEFLKKNGKNTIFNKYLKGKITSIFPSATAACVPTFFSGVAPQQHAITGWFMYLKEINTTSLILPFISREDYNSIKKKIKPRVIFNQKSMFDKIKVNSYLVMPKYIVNSNLTIAMAGKAKRVGHENLGGYFKEIRKIILSNNKRKFIHAYWNKYDSICHDNGIKSRKAMNHFRDLNKKLTSFLKSIEGTDTTVIITADHGAIDTEKSSRIKLSDHPKLKETLRLPLCAEARVVYCYVHPKKKKQFEDYINKKFRRYCNMYKSKDLVKKNYFGLFKPNKKLFDRVGDYVLIMKKNYILKDWIGNEKKKFNIGDHGGTSKEEMFVPLIVIKR